MKTIKIFKETIPAQPARDVYTERYECESCGTKHDVSCKVQQCPMCGNDVCYDCGIWVNVLPKNPIYKDEDGEWQLSDYDYSRVCKHCHSKIIKQNELYQNKLEGLFDKFNQEANELRDKYLRGELC